MSPRELRNPALLLLFARCKEHHGRSGLTQRVRDSSTSMRDAEEAVLEFVKQYTEPGAGILSGNSVHVDRMFLLRHMPELAAHLSYRCGHRSLFLMAGCWLYTRDYAPTHDSNCVYRIVDVSTIKELAKRWFPSASRKAPRKECAHTALSDVRESIQELLYFRKAIFQGGGKGK